MRQRSQAYGRRGGGRSRRALVAGLLLALLAGGAGAAPVQRTLENGVRVVAERYPSAPVAAVRFYLRAGSVHEGALVGSGVSHLVEHTVYRGTARFSAEEIRDRIGRLGEQSNAYTSREVVCYHLTTSAEHLREAVELLAELVLAPTLTEEGVAHEREIILREMLHGADEPGRQVHHLLARTLYLQHPRRHPIIGYEEAFLELTAAEARAYHQARYAPDNLVVALVGDFAPEQALEVAEEILAAYPTRAAAPVNLPEEPPLTAAREEVREQEGLQRTWQLMGWRGASLFSEDMYPLDVLAVILGRGDSSRLVKRLLHEEGLVEGVWAYSDTPVYDAGSFVVGAVGAPEDAEAVAEAVREELRRVREQGVSAEEVARAVRLVRADLTFAQQTAAQRAEALGRSLLETGDAEFDQRYLERLSQVRREEVRAAARRYLDPEVYARAVLRPAGLRERRERAAERRAEAQSELLTLGNGLRVIVTPLPGSGVVYAVTATRAGLRLEPEGKAGLSNFAAELLTRGTARASREQIAYALEERGARLSSYSGRNSLGLTGAALAEEADLLLGILADCLRQPSFPEEEIERVRRQVLGQIAAQENSPHQVTARLLAQLLYTQHPYRHPDTGTRETVESFTQEDLARFYRSLAAPEGTVLHLTGEITPQQGRELAQKYLGGWRAEAAPPEDPAPEPPLEEWREGQRELPQAQAVLHWGWPGPRVDSEERAVWEVLAGVLNARSNVGLLFPPLRDAGLVYGAGAYLIPGLDPGQLVIWVATDPEKIEAVRVAVEEALRRLREERLEEAALQEVQEALITRQALALASPGDRAQTQALDELYGLGYDNWRQYAASIRAVTAEAVQELARERVRPDRGALAVTRPRTGQDTP